MKELREETRGLPRDARESLLEQIEEHLEEAVPAGASEASVRDAIEQLGDARMLAAEARDRLDVGPVRAGTREKIAVFALPFGGLLFPVIGWLVGVALLWWSKVWTTREKVIGTLLPPGGLSVMIYLLARVTDECTSTGGIGRLTVEICNRPLPIGVQDPLLAAFLLAGIVTPFYLARRAFSD
jgi:hypothetical protein